MKMIRAIVRPEWTEAVIDGLSEAGYYSLTKINVFGRGKQKGITVGDIHYDELPKTLIMMVVEDSAADEVISIISEKAYTGNIGDGKIFVNAIEAAYTISSGTKGL